MLKVKSDDYSFVSKDLLMLGYFFHQLLKPSNNSIIEAIVV